MTPRTPALSDTIYVMKSGQSETTHNPQFDKFSGFMRQLLAVPHEEIKQKMAEYKRRPKRKKRAKT